MIELILAVIVMISFLQFVKWTLNTLSSDISKVNPRVNTKHFVTKDAQRDHERYQAWVNAPVKVSPDSLVQPEEYQPEELKYMPKADQIAYYRENKIIPPAEVEKIYWRRKILTPTEIHFYRSLREAVGEFVSISMKTRLPDILNHKEYSHFGRIKAKHVDFILIDPDTFDVLAAIELDDWTHNSNAAQKRDDVKNRAFANAGIPLIRIHCSNHYDLRDLRITICKECPSLTQYFMFNKTVPSPAAPLQADSNAGK